MLRIPQLYSLRNQAGWYEFVQVLQSRRYFILLGGKTEICR